MKLVDISKLKGFSSVKVMVNGKPTHLQIGDKLRFPDESAHIKTVASMQVFEDASVNYVLKWHDGTEFKSEVVSLNDLLLLKENVVPRTPVSLSNGSKNE